MLIPVQARAYLSSSGYRMEPNPRQDTLPSQSHPYSLKLGQFRHTNSPYLHIFGMWEETGVPWRNPCRHGENMPIHTDTSPSWELIFFSFEHYNETLFETLLYINLHCFIMVYFATMDVSVLQICLYPD